MGYTGQRVGNKPWDVYDKVEIDNKLKFKKQVEVLQENTTVPDGYTFVVEDSIDLNGNDINLQGSAKIRFEGDING